MKQNNSKKVSLRETFDFKEVPEWYPVCCLEECPQKDRCLRYQVVSYVPQEIGAWLCVMPGQLNDGECSFFAEIQPIVLARGFRRLFDQVEKQEATQMRKELVEFFHGKRQYYWYFRGERTLSPEQQSWMRQWLKGWGYEWDLPFDVYEEAYFFTKETGDRRFTACKPMICKIKG